MEFDFDNPVNRKGTDSIKWNEDVIESICSNRKADAFWVADMDFKTEEHIKLSAQREAELGIFGYPLEAPVTGIFAQWAKKRHDWEIDESKTTFVNGLLHGVALAVDMFSKEGDGILIPSPTYRPFMEISADSKRAMVDMPLKKEQDGKFSLDRNLFLEKLSQAKLVLFCSPHNPSGLVFSLEDLRFVLSEAKKQEKLVISDEIHCDLTRKGMQHTPLGKVMPDYGRLVTCMAPSKTFNMAGLMFSNVIIRDSGLMATWKARHYDFENPISIAAAQAAYQHGEDWLNELHDYLDKNFAFTGEFLKENLPDAKYQVSEATYLAWVDLSAYFTPDEDLPMFFANEAGVLLEGGDMFVQNSDCFIRLNLACPKSVLEEGLKRIAKATLNK